MPLDIAVSLNYATQKPEARFVTSTRTPIGKPAGALADLSATEL